MLKIINILLCSLLLAFVHSTEAAQKPKLVLYYSPQCGYSVEVLRYLKEIKKTIPMKDVRKDPQAKKELKEIGGVLAVPCLVIDGTALYRSDAIIEWLAEHQSELD